MNRSALELIDDEVDHRTGELIGRLLEQEHVQEGGRCCNRSAEDDLRRLRWRRADHHQRLLERAIGAGARDEIEEHWREALTWLREAERITPAYAAPGRFRRIAQAWLNVWRRGRTWSDEHDLKLTAPDHERFAAYLTQLLHGLEPIATGADQPA